MNFAILACTGMDKPEGAVAREVAIRCVESMGAEVICPVLLNRAPARYNKELSDTTLVVIDGCSTRCASKLAAGLDIGIGRKVMVADAVKASGQPLEPTLRLGPNGLSIARTIVDQLVGSAKMSLGAEPPAAFDPPTEFLLVKHDKFEFRIPAVGYLFNENDVWVRLQNGVARIGISDYMQQKLTDITYFDPTGTGRDVEQFGEICVLESAKAVFEVLAPITGAVIAVNAEVVDNPGLINEDPYGAGWLADVRPSAWLEDQDFLLSADAYARTVERKAAEDE